MFKQNTRWRAIRVIFLLMALTSLSSATYGQGSATGPPQNPTAERADSKTPPVEQALVPEGVLAIQLAEALKLGQTEDEAQAENLLGGVGIEPRNGWITEYPVTPAVIGDIEKSVAAASDTGKLGLPKDQALKALGDVKAKLGLDVSTESAPTSNKPVDTSIYKYTDKNGVVHITNEYGSIPEEYRNRVTVIHHTKKSQSSVGISGAAADADAPVPEYAESPEIINNYYYTEGPPVVTYYPPPEPYDYLYSWMPYPFWSSGFFFPGFFVLHDFHRHVWFNKNPYVVSRHFHDGPFGHKFAWNPGGGFRHASPNQMPLPPSFYPRQFQTNARGIVTFNPHHQVFPGSFGPPRTVVPPRQSFGTAQVHPNLYSRMPVPQRNPGFTSRYRGQIFNPPVNNSGRFVFSPPARSFMPQPIMPRPGFNPQYSPRGNAFGGFHGGGGFGGVHGGGFGRPGIGGGGGGMRGGHR